MAGEAGSRRLIVAITGATGSIYGIRLLQVLQGSGIETHLILSRCGARTLVHETSFTPEAVKALATQAYPDNDLGAAVASGSFVTTGMLVVPCSMKTLAAIAHGQADELVVRAADVVLKERRRLVLCVREAPFNDIHLENMLKLSRMGVVIAPPLPAFYSRPRTLDDLVNHTVSRLLDLFDIHLDVAQRWSGLAVGGIRPPKGQAPPRRGAARERRSRRATSARGRSSKRGRPA